MAEPLKTYYGPEVPKKIAASISSVWPAFPKRRFLADALDGYEELELAKSISLRQHTTRTHFPGAHEVEILVNSFVIRR